MRKHLARAVGAAAAGLGHAVRIGRALARYAPGWLGAGLVSWGAGLVYLPAGLIVGGMFLLAVDLLPAGGEG